MNRHILVCAALLGTALWSSSAGASGDYGCTPTWSLDVSSYECAGSAIIGPRNDTRANLAFLLRDQAGISAPGGLSYPAWDWDNSDFGHVFISWDVLQQAFWPSSAVKSDLSVDNAQQYAGSRCQTLISGGDSFRSALASATGLKPSERETLNTARDLVKPACEGDKSAVPWPSVTGTSASRWLAYLQGAQAFYADDFATARARFKDLAQANDPWLAETARYMIARNELAAAQAGAFDEWGGYAGGDKVDRPSAQRAKAALSDYLAAYPNGIYTTSASGLTRRAAWLLGDSPTLMRAYSRNLTAPQQSPAMLEEVESKVFFGAGLTNGSDAPLLLATWDLLRMRQREPQVDLLNEAPPTLTAQELASQKDAFSARPDLYGFLRASFAFHVAKDYRSVLVLIPDHARNTSFTPLTFSGQMLRAMALAKVGDNITEEFLQQMMVGSKDLYQKPTVQLALAEHWERSGQLGKVFAADSPITEPEIRTMLLARIAGSDLLRQQSTAGIERTEKDVATFTLLTKALSRGQYTQFVRDLALVPNDASTSGWVGDGWSSNWMDPTHDGAPPVGLFTKGKMQEAFPCPAVGHTATTLTQSPANPTALLCLAEFWRLNGFDDYLSAKPSIHSGQLGGSTDHFTGMVMPRSALYARVLSNKQAGPENIAYALYRSVQCYAPTGNNACGGSDVPKAIRKAWFQQLKREFPESRWAIDLRYYW